MIHRGLLVIFILQSKLWGWMIDIDFIIISMIWNKICTLCVINHWSTMIVLYLSCFFSECHVSLFFSQISNQWYLGIFCHNFTKQPKNYINLDFPYWSTQTFEVTQLTLHKEASTKNLSNIRGQTIVVSYILNQM